MPIAVICTDIRVVDIGAANSKEFLYMSLQWMNNICLECKAVYKQLPFSLIYCLSVAIYQQFQYHNQLQLLFQTKNIFILKFSIQTKTRLHKLRFSNYNTIAVLYCKINQLFFLDIQFKQYLQHKFLQQVVAVLQVAYHRPHWVIMMHGSLDIELVWCVFIGTAPYATLVF